MSEVNEIAKTINAYGADVVVIASVIVLNIYFIWQAFKREQRLERQLTRLQEHHDAAIVPILNACREALAACQEVIRQNSVVLMRCTKCYRLRGRKTKRTE